MASILRLLEHVGQELDVMKDLLLSLHAFFLDLLQLVEDVFSLCVVNHEVVLKVEDRFSVLLFVSSRNDLNLLL